MSKRRRRPRVPTRPQTPDVEKLVQDAVTKALALPAGTTTTQYSIGYLQQLQAMGPRGASMSPLPRSPYNNMPFGPGDPLYSEAISPLLPGTNRPTPRQWEYPVSWNLQTTATRAVPWSILRDVADGVPLVRGCIDTCKSALIGLDWSFSIDGGKARALAKRSGVSNHEVIVSLQDKYADQIDRLHQWWCHPRRGWSFSEWLNAVLEDELVYDAVALYPRFDLRGEELLEIQHIDSSTIKPLQDERGDIPAPPLVAYQQILWGFPRGDYQQSVDADWELADAEGVSGPLVINGRRTDTLIYKVRNRRTKGPYGLSCVEQALPAVDLWLKRWEWLAAEFSAGVTPQMLLKVDGSMTPEQMREWEAIFNDELSGNTAERHRAKFIPDGFEPEFPKGFEAKFNSDLDLHLVRLICSSFAILPTSLGFTPNHGMGGTGGMGHQKGEQDSQLARSTKPRAKWIVEIINEISRNYLGMPPEVTFTFHGLDEENEQKLAELTEGRLKSGLMTLNEGRDEMNMPRFTIRQANEPFVATPTGPAFFDPDVPPVGLPGNLPSVPANHPGSPDNPSNADELEAKPEVPDTQDDQEKRAEQKAFFTFIRKRAKSGGWRDFTFEVHDPDIAEAANRLAAAGDVDAVKALFAMQDDAG